MGGSKPCCRNCHTYKGHLWWVESREKGDNKIRSYYLCSNCKTIWEDYAALAQIHENTVELEDNILPHLSRESSDPTLEVKKRLPDKRPPRGFQGTACRVDVYQYVTSPGSLGYQLTFLRDD